MQWKRTLEENRSLKQYVDRMLALVIVVAPQILERKTTADATLPL